MTTVFSYSKVEDCRPVVALDDGSVTVNILGTFWRILYCFFSLNSASLFDFKNGRFFHFLGI